MYLLVRTHSEIYAKRKRNSGKCRTEKTGNTNKTQYTRNQMNNGNNSLVEKIITRFHSERFSGKAKKNFYLWLLSDKDDEAKDAAMNGVWNNIPYSINRSVYRSLDRVKVRLGMAAPRKGVSGLARAAMKAAAVLLPAMIITGIYFSIPGETEWTQISVPHGETGHYVLADGTEVWLNAGSVLEYPEKFRRRKREVKLDGEGFFDVAADKKKPFVVISRNMETTVIGTEFNVASYENLKNVSVIVLSGQVEVATPDSHKHSLVPDRMLTHNSKTGETTVEEVDAAALIRWMNNELVFENSTFEDILYTIKRKFNLKIMVDPDHFDNSLYRMRFVNGEPLDYILDVVHSVVGLSYKLEAGVLTVGADPAKARELKM